MQVPVYQRQAEQQGLPNARQTTQVDASNFLGGTEAAALKYGEQAAGDINKAVQHHYEQQLQEANATRTQSAINDINKHDQHAYNNTSLGADGKPVSGGWANVLGQDVFKQPNGKLLQDNVMAARNQKIGEIAASLGNDQQRNDFMAYADRSGLQVQGRIEGHMTQEYRGFQKTTAQDTIDTESNSMMNAYNDHAAMQAHGAAIDQAAIQLSAINGSGEEHGKVLAQQARSKAYRGAINASIQNGDVQNAHAIIERFGDTMDPADRDNAKSNTFDAAAALGIQSNPQVMADATKPRDLTLPGMGFEQVKQLRDTIESHGKDYNLDGSPVTHKDKDGIFSKYKNQVRTDVAFAPGYGVRPAANDSPEEFNRVGDELLKSHYDYHNGDVEKTLAAYNAGRRGVDDALKEGGDWQARAGVKGYLDKAKTEANKTGTWLDYGSPEQKLRVNRAAESMLYRSRSVEAAKLENAAGNQYTKTYNTGQSGDLMTKESFVSAFGQAEGEAKHQNYLDNQAHAATAFSLKDMTLAKLNETVAAAMPTADRGYGLRPDGTGKGAGYLGELKRPDGGIMTEYSVGVTINGKNMDIPSIVPTLNKDEVNQILNLKEGEFPSDTIIEKATKFAEDRIAKGLPVFHDTPTDTANFTREQKQYDELQSIATHVQNERMKDPGAVPRQLGFQTQDVNLENLKQALPELSQRPAIAAQMNEKYGVPLTLLSNAEASSNTAQLKAMTPDIKAETLGKLSAAIPDRRAFFSLMNQIAPDSPVTRMSAGMMAYPSQMQTAQTLLAGESILNLNKDDKKQDGNTSKLPLPSDDVFKASILEEVGGSYMGQSQSSSARFQDNFQAIRAYYTAKAFETGKLNADSKVIDDDLLKESVKSVTGGVAEWGNQKAFVPWGMKQDDFEDQIPGRIQDVLKRSGYVSTNWKSYNLAELDNGRYQLAVGGRVLPGAIVDFNAPMQVK